MRIAIIAEICNSKSGARAPIELAKALAKENEVFFYATNQNQDTQTKRELDASKVAVRLINTSSKPFISKWIVGIKLKGSLEKDKPQVLSTHCTLPLFFGCKLSHIPTVMTYHGTQFHVFKEKVLPGSLLYLALAPLDKLANVLIYIKSAIPVLTANAVIAISQYTQKELKGLYRRSAPYIYWGALPQNFAQLDINHRPDNKQIKILSVSRFTPYKGFHHLVRIFNQLSRKYPKLELTIAGSLGSQKYLNHLKQIANDKVDFIVNCNDKKLIKLYQSCGIYATGDHYPLFGMPLLEAAAFGKPLLALNFCAAKEMIKHGETGFVANNLSEFKNYLEKLIQDKNLRQTMGKKAKEWSKEFRWEETAREYKKVFRTVIK